MITNGFKFVSRTLAIYLDLEIVVILKLNVTRKYPLRGYILDVLTHTTAWDLHWGGDVTLK